MSSRENPKAIWVRSLVPNEKKSASAAIASATRTLRGISIIVPTRYFTLTPAVVTVSAATRSITAFWSRNSPT